MINHIVLFKLKDYPANEKTKVVEELKSLLESLKGKIKEVKHLEVGTNYELKAKSYDIALISHFESLEDLDTYRVHPEHLKVVERIKETTSERAAVDYKF
ncbi:Stress responsive A/B Barrel Domain [Tangfeifania diversioriginum]|uniref:Stress responsive A/B Barrel Domain n=1 Tax=Tangfeifania diversioriginum TaxID=1168035 RepID=A0A1M6FPQ8_9BACT|nr:Dabb family protein [Tangfeifania diversioriginum]SHI99569.1 Stress responsive A/B Barrel Domain [Tangfeifania diversioriginum]